MEFAKMSIIQSILFNEIVLWATEENQKRLEALVSSPHNVSNVVRKVTLYPSPYSTAISFAMFQDVLHLQASHIVDPRLIHPRYYHTWPEFMAPYRPLEGDCHVDSEQASYDHYSAQAAKDAQTFENDLQASWTLALKTFRHVRTIRLCSFNRYQDSNLLNPNAKIKFPNSSSYVSFRLLDNVITACGHNIVPVVAEALRDSGVRIEALEVDCELFQCYDLKEDLLGLEQVTFENLRALSLSHHSPLFQYPSYFELTPSTETVQRRCGNLATHILTCATSTIEEVRILFFKKSADIRVPNLSLDVPGLSSLRSIHLQRAHIAGLVFAAEIARLPNLQEIRIQECLLYRHRVHGEPAVTPN